MAAIHKELIDGVEGKQFGSKNYRFCPIGEPISIDSDADSTIYDVEKPPSQPLALSGRFGLLFIAHSTGNYTYMSLIYVYVCVFLFKFLLLWCLGFCVVKTRDVINASKKTQGRASVQELSVVDVPIGKVSILALSADSKTLVVSIDGSAHLHFFSVTALLNKVVCMCIAVFYWM